MSDRFYMKIGQSRKAEFSNSRNYSFSLEVQTFLTFRRDPFDIAAHSQNQINGATKIMM